MCRKNDVLFFRFGVPAARGDDIFSAQEDHFDFGVGIFFLFHNFDHGFRLAKVPFLVILRNDNSYEVGAGFAEQNRRSGESHKTQFERFIFQTFSPIIR